MKFFIDFEATQYSEYIISIGCVSEVGEKFYTLVHPIKKKLTPFITEMTGITNEMLESAPDPDSAFTLFADFVKETSRGEVPEYYCYGSGDKKFIERTLNRMHNFYAIIFAQSIMSNLSDYSVDVLNYFNSFKENAPSLFKTYLFLANRDGEKQNHDSLEDAQMLKYIYEHLEEAIPADAERVYNIEVAPKPYPKKKSELPEYVVDWTHRKKKKIIWEVCGSQKPTTKIIAYNNERNLYFDSIEEAVYWINHFFRQVSLRDKGIFENTKSRIEKVLDNGKAFYGFQWMVA